MNTSVFVESPGRRTNRRHGTEFKAQVVLAARQPGVSVAAVALANGLNANMLRRWMLEAERVGPPAPSCGQRAVAKSAPMRASNHPSFVAVQMPAPPAPPAAPKEVDIHIELTRGPTTVVMRWPASVAGACASWLREMLR